MFLFQFQFKYCKRGNMKIRELEYLVVNEDGKEFYVGANRVF